MRSLHIVALVLMILSTVAGVSASSDWLAISKRLVSGVALFDIDRDGEVEVVGSSFIFDQGVLVDIEEAVVLKAPFDGDDELDLAIYYPSTGVVYVYGTTVSRTYSIEREARSFSVHSSGFRIGRTVFGGGKSFVASERGVPIVVGYELCVAEFSEGSAEIVCPNRRTTVFRVPGDYRVVDAFAKRDTIFLLLSSPSNSIYIEYSEGGAPLVSVHQTTFKACLYADDTFICTDGYRLYSVSSRLVPLPVVAPAIYPVEVRGRFATAYGNTVEVYDCSGSLQKVISVRDLPGSPLSVDFYRGVLVVATVSGVYLYTPSARVPSVEVRAPAVATVGSKVAVNVSGVYDYAVVSVGAVTETVRESPARVVVELYATGTATVTVKACVEGGICVSESRTIHVVARRMNLEVEVPRVVEPYGNLTVVLRTIDAATGSEVRLASCTVTVAGADITYPARPFAPLTVVARPVGNEVVLTVSCSAINYVANSTSVRIPLSKPYLDVAVSYLGSGRFRVEAYNVYTGEIFDGEVRVTVGGNATIFRRGGIFSVPQGSHTVLVELVRDGVTLLRREYSVLYYGTVFDVPAGEVIKVADRPVVTTVTQTAIATTTRTEVRINTVERVNTPLALGLIVVGLGVGLSLSYILTKDKGRVGGK